MLYILRVRFSLLSSISCTSLLQTVDHSLGECSWLLMVAGYRESSTNICVQIFVWTCFHCSGAGAGVGLLGPVARVVSCPVWLCLTALPEASVSFIPTSIWHHLFPTVTAGAGGGGEKGGRAVASSLLGQAMVNIFLCLLPCVSLLQGNVSVCLFPIKLKKKKNNRTYSFLEHLKGYSKTE